MAAKPRQQGIALLVVLALVALGSIYGLLYAMNEGALRAARFRVTQDALLQAKEALIAYAATDAVRPGELPCPDINDDGKLVIGEDIIGSSCARLIGRLPWKTLGIPDLRDAAGERLWYSLSNDFHANGTIALNSDTAYVAGNTSLSITGPQSANNVVALLISPGSVLQRAGVPTTQTRGCTVGVDCDIARKCVASPAWSTPKCDPYNYLDSTTAGDNADGDTSFVSAAESLSFNDRLLPITSDDIMTLVEKRAAREFAQELQQQYDNWEAAYPGKGFYPWAAPFTTPSTALTGTNNTTQGLISVGTNPLVWTSASASCSGVGTTTLDCNATIICIFGFCFPSINAQIDNVATVFADPPTGASVQVILGLSLGGGANWSLNQSAQRLDFSYSGFVTAGTLHVRVQAPPTSAWIATSWLTKNDWYQDTYYAVAPAFAINGGKDCTAPGAQCISVFNALSPNDKQAVVVMTGRSLPGQVAHPAGSLTDYLEGGNANTPLDLSFERNLLSSSFNDQATIVRP